MKDSIDWVMVCGNVEYVFVVKGDVFGGGLVEVVNEF